MGIGGERVSGYSSRELVSMYEKSLEGYMEVNSEGYVIKAYNIEDVDALAELYLAEEFAEVKAILSYIRENAEFIGKGIDTLPLDYANVNREDLISGEYNSQTLLLEGGFKAVDFFNNTCVTYVRLNDKVLVCKDYSRYCLNTSKFKSFNSTDSFIFNESGIKKVEYNGWLILYV